MNKYAQLSDTAYHFTLNNKKKYLKQISPDLKLDKDLTNKYITTAVDPFKKEVYISHRGTKLNDFNDISADTSVLLGNENMNKRFIEADTHYLKTKNAYPDHKIIMTGHSLGGSIAKHVAKKHDIEAHVFNQGSSIGAVRDSLVSSVKENKRKNKITHYSTGSDAVSILGNLPNINDKIVIVKPKKDQNPHSLQNFL